MKYRVHCILVFFCAVFLCAGSCSPYDYVVMHLFDQVVREQRCALERASSPVEQAEFYALYDSLVFWLYGCGIRYPPNVEFSIKFSRDGANNKRYVLELPVTVFAGQKKLLDNLLIFLALPPSVQKFLAYSSVMSAYSIIFALEFGDKKRQKVYVDYGYGRGMQSCEWLIDEPEVVSERSYVPIDDVLSVDCYVKNNVSGRRLQAYQRLSLYIGREHSLIKNKNGVKTLCVPFRQEIFVRDVLGYLVAVAPLACQHLVAPFLASSDSFIISWLHIARSEIACYTRLYPWYVAVDVQHSFHNINRVGDYRSATQLFAQ